jgi:predicted O-methyltransferase YrrM
LLQRDPPRSLLEIGTSLGGTFFLSCQVADERARLATVDLELPGDGLVGTFGRAHQHVTGIEGDSTSPEVRAEIEALFPDGLDALFIDGDHSYEGVAADFELYHPLVRSGGLVAFHDIVPTDGSDPSCWAGGVPTFWEELKAGHSHEWNFTEFVKSWDQQGFGIGIATKR